MGGPFDGGKCQVIGRASWDQTGLLADRCHRLGLSAVSQMV